MASAAPAIQGLHMKWLAPSARFLHDDSNKGLVLDVRPVSCLQLSGRLSPSAE